MHFVDQGSNDPGDGILTFNFVRHPYCTGNCLTDGLVVGSNVTATVPAPGPVPGGWGAVGKSYNLTVEQGSDGEKGEVRRRRVGREGGKLLVKRGQEVDGRGDEQEMGVEGRKVSTRSAKFVEVAERETAEERGGKGWIGWLRRRV